MDKKKVFKRSCVVCNKMFERTGRYSKMCEDCKLRRKTQRTDKCRCGNTKYKTSKQCLRCYRIKKPQNKGVIL
jgi:hypothetical protein